MVLMPISGVVSFFNLGILDEQETYRGSVSFDDSLFALWLKSALR